MATTRLHLSFPSSSCFFPLPSHRISLSLSPGSAATRSFPELTVARNEAPGARSILSGPPRRPNLPETPLPDCLTHLLCHWCALAQEYRELARRGFNVDQGTHYARACTMLTYISSIAVNL